MNPETNTIDLTKLPVRQLNADGSISDTTSIDANQIVNPGASQGVGAAATTASADHRPIIPYKAYISSVVRLIHAILYLFHSNTTNEDRGPFGNASDIDLSIQSAVVCFAFRDIVRYAQYPSTVLPNSIDIQFGQRKVLPDPSVPLEDAERFTTRYHWIILNGEETFDILYYAFVGFYGFQYESIAMWRYYARRSVDDPNQQMVPIGVQTSFGQWMEDSLAPCVDKKQLQKAYDRIVSGVYAYTSLASPDKKLIAASSVAFTTVQQNQKTMLYCIYEKLKEAADKSSKAAKQKVSITKIANFLSGNITKLIPFTKSVTDTIRSKIPSINIYNLVVQRVNTKTQKSEGITILIEFVGAEQLISLDMVYHLRETAFSDTKNTAALQDKWKLINPNVRYKLGVFEFPKPPEEEVAQLPPVTETSVSTTETSNQKTTVATTEITTSYQEDLVSSSEKTM